MSKPNVSAIAAHCFHEHGSQPDLNNWGIQILDIAKKTQSRKLLEALWIYHKKPKLNRDVGVKIILKDAKF